MPKQFLKIEQFHGGINTNSDPRDIPPNELSAATDVMVDELGKIRFMGGYASHGTIDARDNQINSGYGLFQFSSDRIAGVVGSLEHLNNTGDFSSNWDFVNDISGDSTDASYAHSAGAGLMTQTAANRAVRGIANTKYAFTYTISGVASTISSFRINGTGSNFASANTDLTATNGTHTTTFTSHATNPNHPFVIRIAGSGSGALNIDNVSLKIYDVAETGDDYLAFSEADTGGTVDVYSINNDVTGAVVWDSPITGMTDNTSGLRKDVFYYADGALRISDADFGNANEPVWYGYVHRYFFGDGTTGYDEDSYNEGLLVSTWFKDDAAPKALPIKSVMGAIAAATPDISSPISIDLDPTGDYQNVSASGTIQDDVDVIQVRVDFSASSPNVTAVTNATPGFSRFCSIGDKINITNAVDDANNAIFTVADVPEYGTDPNPNTMDFEESVLAESNDYVYMTNLSKSAWFDPVNTGWQVAVSTLYDDSKQESALNVSGTTLYPNEVGTNDHIVLTSTGYKKIRIDAHVFAGDGHTTGLALIHSRVSGFKIYMRRQNTSTWYLQAELDMTKGNKWFGRGDWEMWDDGDQLTDCAHADGEYLEFPREVETYESETGYDSSLATVGFDGTSAGFKTAIVANNIAYAGNIKIADWKGNVKTYGDAILKSVVGKFDSFVLERRIETSRSDGDSIIKLEEYADRLLEFKKNKMSLINISQELEFLEDVFMHKGVTHPSAVCKTDYGIAWVNSLGCYFYDGQKVDNLLEKDGRQIIKLSDWVTFAANAPMIGYIPKKRQLLVVDDNFTDGDGSTFLYDMVTRSWVQGAAATIVDQAKTNFVIDWNNDLMWTDTSDTGNSFIWDDAADVSSKINITTKDIDFGQPGQLKNVYKVYLTFRGNATHVQVQYGKDGLAPALNFFPITGATDGSSTGTGAAAKCIAYDTGTTDWLKAELKPGAAITNINSFRLKISGDASNDIASDIEINDISIVYRLKGMR
jgi:hypothetical protein